MTLVISDANMSVTKVGNEDGSSVSIAEHWPMNEFQGTTAYNVVTSNNLTLSGVDVAQGSFDGTRAQRYESSSNDYAAIQGRNFASSGAISDLSVVIWFQTSTSARQTLISFDEDEYFELWIGGVNGRINFQTTDSGSTTQTTTGTTDVRDGNWHQVVATFRNGTGGGDNVFVYVDGSEEASANIHGTLDLGTGTTRYGFLGVESEASSEDGTKGSNYFDGSMAMAAIYFHDLTAAQVSDMYDSGVVPAPPDFIVPNEDILKVRLQQLIDNSKDTGRVTIDNSQETYSSGGNEIVPGDMLRIRVRLEGETDLTGIGTFMARTIVKQNRGANRKQVIIKIDDFVFGVLASRQVNETFEGVSLQTAFQKILDGEATEITQDGINNVTDSVTAAFRGQSGIDAIGRLFSLTDSVAKSVERGLEVVKLSNVSSQFTLTSADQESNIYRLDDSNLVNAIRVEGGESEAIDDDLTDFDHYETVTQTNVLTFQIDTRKSEINRIDLRVNPSGSDSVIIRLQKDDGGSPIDINDPTSDIVDSEIEGDDLVAGFNTFRFQDHTLPEPNPWMIIESDGATGQQIGTDSFAQPNFRAYYPFPISIRDEDATSTGTYRRREAKVQNDSLFDFEAASSIADDELRHNKDPDEFFEFQAASSRTHKLQVAEIVTVSDTETSGEYVVVDKEQEYDGLNLKTTIKMQKTTTV